MSHSRKKVIFKNEGNRKLLLNMLAQISKRFSWNCHVYCAEGRAEVHDQLIATAIGKLGYIQMGLYD